MSTKTKTETVSLAVAPAGSGASPEGERSDLPAARRRGGCRAPGRRFVTASRTS